MPRVAIAIAYLYAISRSGLALRATRDEAVAASASGIDMVRERLIAFVVSAFIIGLAGALYAHFLSIVNPGSFYLRTTFITLSMLVVGGMNSLSGAVSGVVVISALIEMFRDLEKGVSFGGLTIALPNGVQEIAIGVITIVILMYLPTGLTRNREFSWSRMAARATAAATCADGPEGIQLKSISKTEEWLNAFHENTRCRSCGERAVVYADPGCRRDRGRICDRGIRLHAGL